MHDVVEAEDKNVEDQSDGQSESQNKTNDNRSDNNKPNIPNDKDILITFIY